MRGHLVVDIADDAGDINSFDNLIGSDMTKRASVQNSYLAGTEVWDDHYVSRWIIIMSHCICNDKHWPSPPGAHQNTVTAEDPPLLDKACFLARQREEVNWTVPLKQNREHSCWDKSKLHCSFEDSEQTSLCQMCHSEPAGFKAGSHLEGGLRALALFHSVCHILPPLSLSRLTLFYLHSFAFSALPLCHTWPQLRERVCSCMLVHICEFRYISAIINLAGLNGACKTIDVF